jgi:hypothetical protein
MRVASLILVAVLGLTGCIDDSGPALYIEGNIAPDTECFVEGGSTTFVARGLFNPDIGVDYTFNAKFVNQLLSNASEAPPRPDPNGILMQGAEITIMDAAGGTISFGGLPNPFTISNTAFVPSSGGASSGGGTAPGVLTIIPAVYADELAAMAGNFQLLVSIRAFGETLGHVSVDAREFVWPIDVCRGCLIDTSPDAAGSCCLIGQDRAVPETCLLP